MSMERRAVIAFVLSLVVFLAYDAFYLSPRNKKQQERREATLRHEAAIADSIAAVSSTPGEASRLPPRA